MTSSSKCALTNQMSKVIYITMVMLTKAGEAAGIVYSTIIRLAICYDFTLDYAISYHIILAILDYTILYDTIGTYLFICSSLSYPS